MAEQKKKDDEDGVVHTAASNSNCHEDKTHKRPPLQAVDKISGKTRLYEIGKVLGNGSFGVVCEAKDMLTGEKVAIKQVLQDPRYKNRELEIIRNLKHPNIVEMKTYFFTEHERNNHKNQFLHVVMEHIPETVYRVMRSFVKNNQHMSMILVKLYTYQMCRAIGYLHCLGICHRDIKPQNLLVDSRNHVLKLCDFGSAKKLCKGENSVAYICSRFYRAPELMMAALDYTTSIDIWSIGCVFGELLLGRPLFTGSTSMDQLIKIIQILGTPTRKQLICMNPGYSEFRLPDVSPKDWGKVFNGKIPPLAIDLLSRFLQYDPEARLLPLEALSHEFFDELRDALTRLPKGGSLPDLFNFTDLELHTMSKAARQKVIPEWFKNKTSQEEGMNSKDANSNGS